MIEQLNTEHIDLDIQQLDALLNDLESKKDKLTVPAYLFALTALLIAFVGVQLAEGVPTEQESLMLSLCQLTLFMLGTNVAYLGYLSIKGQLPEMSATYNVFTPAGKQEMVIDEKLLLAQYNLLTPPNLPPEYLQAIRLALLLILRASPRVRAEVMECFTRERQRLTTGSAQNRWLALQNVLQSKLLILQDMSRSEEKIQEFAQLIRKVSRIEIDMESYWSES